MKEILGLKLPKAEYLQRWFDKYKYPLLVCLVGFVLLLWPKSADAPTKKQVPVSTNGADQVAVLERQMEDLFSSISVNSFCISGCSIVTSASLDNCINCHSTFVYK